MPTNVSFEYTNAEKEYQDAQTTEAKINALRKMLTTAPKHKGCQRLLKDIKDRISDLKKRQAKEIRQRKSSSGGSHFATIKREGAAQIVIIGFPNAGKSTILGKLSETEVEIAEYPFSTKEPVVRMMPYENIKIQAIEIPAIYAGFYDSPKGPFLTGIIRQSDLVVILVDVVNAKEELEIIKAELRKANVELGLRKTREGVVSHIPAQIIMVKKSDSGLEFPDEKLIKDSIWKNIRKIRIKTRSRGVIAEKPVVLKYGATIGDLARLIHKDFVKNFKYAKVWGKSAKFEGQQVGLAHILKDNDIVEIYTE